MKQLQPLLLLFCLLTAACKTISSEEQPQNPNDFHDVGKGFYQGKDGKLYIKTQALLNVETDKWSKPFFREVPDVEVLTYQGLGTDGWYSKDRKHAYIHYGTTDGDFLHVIDSADAATFEVIGYCWAKDKRHVYAQDKILPGLDPDSLVILCPEVTEYGQKYFGIVKDNDQVFVNDEEAKVDDVASFSCDFVARDSTKKYLYNSDVYDSAYYYFDKSSIYKLDGFRLVKVTN